MRVQGGVDVKAWSAATSISTESAISISAESSRLAPPSPTSSLHARPRTTIIIIIKGRGALVLFGGVDEVEVEEGVGLEEVGGFFDCV